MKRIIMLLGAGILLLCSTVFAAVPQLINFQGILKDGSGNPVANGSYSVQFTLYDTPAGGNVKWQETQSVTTTSGLFSVLLGSSMPVLDSVFKDSSRYLGIKVGADPEMTPRQRLSSVGYSHNSSEWTSAAQNIFRFSGNVGIGTASPGARLDIAGGNVNLENSSATAGNITKGGTRFIHNFGFQNTFIGENAGNLTSSYGNTASGFEALSSNIIGDYNTASGAYALNSNTTGSGNTANGVNALAANTTGNFNTAGGYLALQSNTTGDNNTASGLSALRNNTTGSFNTASGVDALSFNTTGWDNTASGYQALNDNTTGAGNTASGYQALYNNISGNSNTACGYNALNNNINGSDNTAIGYLADVFGGSHTNATAIGAGAVANASNKIRLGNTNVTVIEGQVAYTFPSDKNQKENFRPVDGNEVLRKIRELELSSWNYKGHDPKQFRHYGPMAQDFYAAFGDDGVGKIGTETTLNSGDVAGILMIAVQALGNENAELKARIEALEKRIKESDEQEMAGK